MLPLICLDNFIYFKNKTMKNSFEKILKIKTWEDNLLIKAAFIENAKKHWEWAYYIYYYDNLANTFYINDLYRCETKASSINLVENILNKAYNQELNSIDLETQKSIPKVFCIYEQKQIKEVIINQIDFDIERNKDWSIKSFKNPKWKMSLEDTLVLLWIK